MVKESRKPLQSNERVRKPSGIVGLGASAGGLAALEQFLANVPSDSGLAFVVVQHLDPTRPGLLPERRG
jgi:two-component system CheB/CheR fusion protein